MLLIVVDFDLSFQFTVGIDSHGLRRSLVRQPDGETRTSHTSLFSCQKYEHKVVKNIIYFLSLLSAATGGQSRAGIHLLNFG